ncbi:MAG: ABC-2 transporter permease [Solobacterium sp.]|nr:ABC-2 transporter permease [Solobacterium sp.]
MKALIRKDFYETMTSFRTILIILLFFGATAVFMKDAQFITPYMVILPGSLSSSVVNLEEREKWNLFAGSLPIRRKTVIDGKYVFSIILVLIGAVLAAVCTNIRPGQAFSTIDFILSLLAFFCIGLLIPAFTLPVMYKFGPEKGRYVSMFLIITCVLVFGTGSSMKIWDTIGSFPIWAGGIAIVVVFVLSWLLSIKIYENKEMS